MKKQPSKKSNKLFSFLNGIKWRDLTLNYASNQASEVFGEI
ncbi:hypothetical protein MM0342_00510 [Helicobacter pylori]